MLRKPSERRVQGQQVGSVERDEIATLCPTLWEYMTATTWDDGSARLPSSLLLFAQDGMLKGMLRDRDAGLCLWVAGSSISGLLGVLEAALLDPQTEWRVDRQQPGQTASRKKRAG